jgi:hypothetical protein
LWKDDSHVVTALHVISGCARISAYFAGVGEKPAIPWRALKNADLALLKVAAVGGTAALSSINPRPPFNSTLEAVGYYFGLRTFDSRPLHVTIGSTFLRDMLPMSVLATWSTDVGPDPATRIVRLDGNLVPGLSGAPLIDASGAVAGIGSGGLESGTVGISWAVRADYLDSLSTAPLFTGGYGQTGSRMLFSAPEDEVGTETVKCGSALFYKASSRSLQTLLQTTDDAAGLMQIAATTGLSNFELMELKFDIFTEPQSGASVALPAGANLVPTSTGCAAEPAPGLRVRLSSSIVSGPANFQQQAHVFEANFPAAASGLFWRPDPSFTYRTSINRADGLVVQRKNGLGFAPGDALPEGDAFETLMARGALFVGFEVMNAKYSPPTYQRCLAAPQSTGCSQVVQTYLKWVASVLGVHLSTFPPV